MSIRLRRSALYVPSSNPRALAKCRSVGADALVFDVEDAVGEADRAAALAAAVRTVAEGGFGRRETVIRIKGLGAGEGREGLLAAAAARPSAILLPKVATPGDIMFAAAHLARAGVPETVRIWAMLETAEAVLNALNLARTAVDPASRLEVLVVGTNDLAKDLRIRPGSRREPLLPWLATCVAAARCHGLAILDGVYNRLDDLEGLAAEARQGRDFGMDGKTCIHPDQVEACNAAFAPDVAEVAWARRVVDAFEARDAAPAGQASDVLRIDGRMVERLHADEARRVLALDAAVSGQAAGSIPQG